MYDEMASALIGMEVKDQIQYYQNIYDEHIKFSTYFWNKFPERKVQKFNTYCPLHDEHYTGESFGYSESMNLWSCWGSCGESGRVVHFHYLYGKKSNPDMTYLQALRELHKLYPNLPYPKIYESSAAAGVIETGKVNLKVELKDSKIGNSNIVLKKRKSLSAELLDIILIEKNKESTYRKR